MGVTMAVITRPNSTISPSPPGLTPLWPRASHRTFRTHGARSCRRRTSTTGLRGARPQQHAVADHGLGDLDRVERRAFAEVVGDREEREHARAVRANPADVTRIAAGCGERRRVSS